MLDSSPTSLAPILPRNNQPSNDAPPPPDAQPSQRANKKRGRPAAATSTSLPQQPLPTSDLLDLAIDAAASFTYPDPADSDSNPLLLPCYLPSILPSPQLFQHVLHHFGLFHLRFTGLANAIHSTPGTLSAVLHRKYAFKALGVVKGIREWMSSRDTYIARLIAADIKRRWQRQQQQHPTDEDTKAEQHDDQQQAVDWDHPAFGKEAVESMLSTLHSGLKYGLLMDYLQHRMSVTKKQRVEDILVEHITRLEAERDSEQTGIAQQPVEKKERAEQKKNKKKKKKTEGKTPRVTASVPSSASERPRRSTVALVREEPSDERLAVHDDQFEDEDVQLEEVGADEAKEDGIKEEEEELTDETNDERRSMQKNKRGPRPGATGIPVYILSDESRWPSRHPFPSPFSRPSWSIGPIVTHSFDPTSYVMSDSPNLSFQASGSPVTLQPFTAISSVSATHPATASLLLHAGGSIDAMAWAPVGSPSVSPSAATHYLLVAPSHTKYRSYTPYSGKGVLCLWRVKQQREAAMVLAIEHDRGGVMDMCWYRHGVWQEEGNGDGQGRLGVLAVGFTDGSVVVLAVPHPRPDEPGMRAVHLVSLPHVVLVPPPVDCRLLLPIPVPTSLAFSPHSSPTYLAIGQSHSAVVVYALSCLDPASSSSPPAPSFHLTPRLGHQAVRALTFLPTNPHQLLMATGQGDILLIDLRSPFHPIATIPANTSDPITALHCLAARPSVIVTATRNRPRLHFLLHEAGDIRTLPLRGLSSLRSGTQRPDAGTCWCVDVLEDEQFGATLAVCGWSDGRVDLIGWRTADSELESQGQSRIRRLCWLGWTRPDEANQRRLLLGEGGPSQQVAMRNKASVVEWDAEERVELSSVEMALDEQLAVHHVQANPNVIFPRQFAVGGLAGIVRIQQVSDM